MAGSEFETSDILGTTFVEVDTVTTSPKSLPAVAGNDIEEVWVKFSGDEPSSARLLVSIDGGTTFSTLEPGDEYYREPRRGLYQIQVKAGGNANSVSYDVTLNISSVLMP